MATLPSNRTKLQSAISNQVAGTTADASANIGAVIEAYDTLDLLNQKVDGLVAGGSLQATPPVSLYRQAIINGNFDIWQRGTSFTNPTSGQYTADRWKVLNDGSGQTSTVSQQVFTPGQGVVSNEPKFFLRRQVTAAATGQTYHQLIQAIEGVRSFAGQKVTLSVWIKSDAARTVSCYLVQNFGTGGTPSAATATGSSSFNVTTSWQKFTATFTVPSISGKTLGANGDDSLSLTFTLPINTAFTIDIAQVQLNAGDVAYPFQPKSFADELQACMRYYEKSYDYGVYPGSVSSIPGLYQHVGSPNSTVTAIALSGAFKVPKRAIPSISVYDMNGNINKMSSWNGTTQTNALSVSPDQISQNRFRVLASVTAGNYELFGHFTADAEL